MCDEGMQVHGALLRAGFECDRTINNDLIDMYAKCGLMENARSVFDRISKRNVISWASLMSGYLRLGDAKTSLLLFNEMGCLNVRHNEYTLSTNIKECRGLGALETSEQIHAICGKTGFDLCLVVGNSIIDMYFKCRKIVEAEQMFDEMLIRNLIAWNAMIAGYTNSGGMNDKSLHFLNKMQEHREEPDDVTLSSALKACRGHGAIREGKQKL